MHFVIPAHSTRHFSSHWLLKISRWLQRSHAFPTLPLLRRSSSPGRPLNDNFKHRLPEIE